MSIASFHTGSPGGKPGRGRCRKTRRQMHAFIPPYGKGHTFIPVPIHKLHQSPLTKVVVHNGSFNGHIHYHLGSVGHVLGHSVELTAWFCAGFRVTERYSSVVRPCSLGRTLFASFFIPAWTIPIIYTPASITFGCTGTQDRNATPTPG